MYNSQEIADRIKERAKEQGISVTQLLERCELGKNTISKIAKGTDILTLNFAKIADVLECSTDYLLCRTDNPEIAQPKEENLAIKYLLLVKEHGEAKANEIMRELGYAP